LVEVLYFLEVSYNPPIQATSIEHVHLLMHAGRLIISLLDRSNRPKLEKQFSVPRKSDFDRHVQLHRSKLSNAESTIEEQLSSEMHEFAGGGVDKKE
jgi:hypothetical protein